MSTIHRTDLASSIVAPADESRLSPSSCTLPTLASPIRSTPNSSEDVRTASCTGWKLGRVGDRHTSGGSSKFFLIRHCTSKRPEALQTCASACIRRAVGLTVEWKVHMDRQK
ncbi:hypothetical protein COCOBI_01-3540 [Coccomyxa sp. Obi]|nr:hypothetical protein COCOBI_01-3540 [Coccomyxa sp. Obi]